MKNATQRIVPLDAAAAPHDGPVHPQALMERAIDSLRVELDPIVTLDATRAIGHETRLRCDERLLNGASALTRLASKLGRRRDVGRRARTLAAITVGLTKAPFVFLPIDGTDLLDGELYDPTSPLSRVAERVVLVLAEQIPFEDLLNLHSRVVDLRRLGFSVAIDGVGVSSPGLAACAVMAPDFVRLDPTLLQQIHRAAGHRLLVRGLCSMFIRLGSRVIAAGIESAIDRDIVSALGCELGQGALFKSASTLPSVGGIA